MSTYLDEIFSPIGKTDRDTSADANGEHLEAEPAPGFTDEPGDSSDNSFSSSHLQWPAELTEPAFHGIAGDIVRKIEPHTEADPAALLIQLLVMYGNCIGRSAYFVADGSRHYTNNNVVLVGPTSKGRKGTAGAHVRRLFQTTQPAWESERILSGLSSGEGLIWAVRDPIKTRVPIKVKGRFTGEYDEVESDPGVEDKRLLILEGEFAQPLKVIQREGNTLSPIIRQAWDTGNLRVLTKNSAAKATDGHISIIGHITKDELRKLLDAIESANGFANRFLWTCVHRSKCLPDGGAIHTVDFSSVLRGLEGSIEYGKQREQLFRDEDARELWHEVYPKLSEGAGGMFGAVTTRGEAHVMRLAATYSLLDQCPWIKRVHMDAALAVWKFCEDSARYLFGGSLGDKVADNLLQALRLCPDGLTRKAIMVDVFKKNAESSSINRALAMLQESGLARFVTEHTGGRPAERWFATMGTTNKTNKPNKGSE